MLNAQWPCPAALLKVVLRELSCRGRERSSPGYHLGKMHPLADAETIKALGPDVSGNGRKTVEAFEVRVDGALVCDRLSTCPEASIPNW